MDYVCDICEYNYKSQHNLDKHLESCKSCFICKQKLCNRLTVEKHIRNCLSPETRQCNKCRRKFQDFDTLWWHVTDKKCWDTSKNKHCHVCGFYYAGASEYEQHLSWCKPLANTGYRCLFCAKFFDRSLDMLQHLQWHMPKIMIKCKECPAYFMKEEELTEHTKLHAKTEEKKVPVQPGHATTVRKRREPVPPPTEANKVTEQANLRATEIAQGPTPSLQSNSTTQKPTPSLQSNSTTQKPTPSLQSNSTTQKSASSLQSNSTTQKPTPNTIGNSNPTQTSTTAKPESLKLVLRAPLTNSSPETLLQKEPIKSILRKSVPETVPPVPDQETKFTFEPPTPLSEEPVYETVSIFGLHVQRARVKSAFQVQKVIPGPRAGIQKTSAR